MSSIGMMGADILESLVSSTRHGSSQKFKQDFQQLGQDLQSGNVTRGQADLTALQSDISSSSTSSSSSSSSSASVVTSQAFSQIAQDLQSGNLTAAQSDYANLQQGLQQGQGRARPPPFSQRSRKQRAHADAKRPGPVRTGPAVRQPQRRAASLHNLPGRYRRVGSLRRQFVHRRLLYRHRPQYRSLKFRQVGSLYCVGNISCVNVSVLIARSMGVSGGSKLGVRKFESKLKTRVGA